MQNAGEVAQCEKKWNKAETFKLLGIAPELIFLSDKHHIPSIVFRSFANFEGRISGLNMSTFRTLEILEKPWNGLRRFPKS